MTLKMKVIQKLRIIYHLVVLIIFVFQAQESIYKYFQHPVVIQKISTTIDKIEKPAVHICRKEYFNYVKAKDYGYSMQSKFLAGMIEDYTAPTWKGIDQDSNFSSIRENIYYTSFSKVEMDKARELIYKFGKGFCLEISGLENDLEIKSTEKNIRVYFVQDSTNKKIYTDTSPDVYIDLSSTSNATYEYRVYKIVHAVYDNTIYEGISCVDYRKHKEKYGECNYNAFKKLILSHYGCYPPWIDDTDGKECEKDLPSYDVEADKFKKVWQDINDLTDAIEIDVMKKCMQPCYMTESKPIEQSYMGNYIGKAVLRIMNTETVAVYKAVYSFDNFTLAVELGSALGLWLGTCLHDSNIKLT